MMAKEPKTHYEPLFSPSLTNLTKFFCLESLYSFCSFYPWSYFLSIKHALLTPFSSVYLFSIMIIWPHFSSGNYHNLYASLTLDPTVPNIQKSNRKQTQIKPWSAFCVRSRSALGLPGCTQTWPWANLKLMQSRPTADAKQTQGLLWC